MIKFAVATLCAIVLDGCTSPSPSQRTPSGVSDEDQRIDAAKAKADFALCKTHRSDASINQRVEQLNGAIAILENMTPSERNKSLVQTQLEELRMYKRRSTANNYFWDWGSTCPRQLHFPTTTVGTSPSNKSEAFARAQSYRNIAFCIPDRGAYSISDRVEFLDAAIAIFDELAKGGELATQALAEGAPLHALQRPAHADNLRFWDVGSTCPARR